MPQKLHKNISEEDFNLISETLEHEGLVVFEEISTSFSEFKTSFDSYQKLMFENEIKYVAGSYETNETRFHYYRNPERLSNNYAKKLMKSNRFRRKTLINE